MGHQGLLCLCSLPGPNPQGSTCNNYVTAPQSNCRQSVSFGIAARQILSNSAPTPMPAAPPQDDDPDALRDITLMRDVQNGDMDAFRNS